MHDTVETAQKAPVEAAAQPGAKRQRLNHRAEEGGLWVGTAGHLGCQHDLSVYADAKKGAAGVVRVNLTRGAFMLSLDLPPDVAREFAQSLVEAAGLVEEFRS
jgi:hypothetical protein